VYVSEQTNPPPQERKPSHLDWSEDEKRLLRHEEFINQIIRLRTHTAPEKKPTWLLFLESSGGTALIAAVIGAVLVQWISGSIQASLKEREFRQSWMQARGNQALTAYKEQLDQEEQIVRRAYDLVGSTIQASQDLIDLTGPELSLKTYRPSQRKKIEVQRDRIRKAYNKADVEWRGQKENLSLLIALYHHAQPDIISRWQDVQNSIPGYMDCALNWYDTHETASADTLKTGCVNESKILREKLELLTASLGDFRSKGREDWESPDQLIQKLEKANQK
jgi:hypothetical protein